MADAAQDDGVAPEARAENPQPDTISAIKFLQWWRPTGVLTLSAIEPDGPIDTQDWKIDDPAAWDRIARWIDGWQGRRNLYFIANEAWAVSKKPAKEDMTTSGRRSPTPTPTRRRAMPPAGPS